MQRDRNDIESALLRKGFVKEQRDHRRFVYRVNGRYTSVFTFLSHGSGYKTYATPLLKKVKQQMCLHHMNDLLDFIDCPMSELEYRQLLIDQGRIQVTGTDDSAPS